MKPAIGPTTAVLHFDADKTAKLRPEQVEFLAYHIARLITGERTATSEWVSLGVMIDVEPDTDGGDEG